MRAGKPFKECCESTPKGCGRPGIGDSSAHNGASVSGCPVNLWPCRPHTLRRTYRRYQGSPACPASPRAELIEQSRGEPRRLGLARRIFQTVDGRLRGQRWLHRVAAQRTAPDWLSSLEQIVRCPVASDPASVVDQEFDRAGVGVIIELVADIVGFDKARLQAEAVGVTRYGIKTLVEGRDELDTDRIIAVPRQVQHDIRRKVAHRRRGNHDFRRRRVVVERGGSLAPRWELAARGMGMRRDRSGQS
jgi:hypothetical protein